MVVTISLRFAFSTSFRRSLKFFDSYALSFTRCIQIYMEKSFWTAATFVNRSVTGQLELQSGWKGEDSVFVKS